MISYLWVAVGSALGGMGRYGLGLFIGRLVGESFPWGTLLINVLGSFVIGFFGALTVPQGALPASPNLRIFVMVGICGGFTTFSSFSLQTLNLARDGAWFAAISNVVLSVVVCIAAVTIGQLSAERIGMPHAEAPAVSHSILAVLDRRETAGPVLVAAGLAAERLGEASLHALHVRHDAMAGFMPTEEVMSQQRRQENEGQAARLSGELRAIFDRWQATSGVGTWREVTGDTARMIAEQAAGSDLIVIGLDPARPHADAGQAVHAALFVARLTTLLVPARAPVSLGRRVAVAWQPSGAASRAIDAALPLLLRAERVGILIENASESVPAAPAELLRRLRQAGIPVDVTRFQAAGRPIGEALIAQAHAEGSDLLVMGAYTHSRMQEFILGGATREVLAAADLPVLMHH